MINIIRNIKSLLKIGTQVQCRPIRSCNTFVGSHIGAYLYFKFYGRTTPLASSFCTDTFKILFSIYKVLNFWAWLLAIFANLICVFSIQSMIAPSAPRAIMIFSFLGQEFLQNSTSTLKFSLAPFLPLLIFLCLVGTR